MSADRIRNVVEELSEALADCDTYAKYRALTLEHLHRRVGFDCASLQSTATGSCGLGFAMDDDELTCRQAAWANEFDQGEIVRMSRTHAARLEEVFPSPSRRARLAVFAAMHNPHSAVGRVWVTRRAVLGIVVTRSGFAAPLGEWCRALLDALVPLLTLSEGLFAEKHAGNENLWARAYGLTARQTEVAVLNARGLRNKEIAELLNCSERTVKNHLEAIFRKSDVSSRAELAHDMLTHVDAPRDLRQVYQRFSSRVRFASEHIVATGE